MIEICKGNVLEPVWPDTNRLIIHCCNDLGLMGAGVALQIRKKWPVVYAAYDYWCNGNILSVEDSKKVKFFDNDRSFTLGNIQIVKVDQGVYVCNLIGQKGISVQHIGRFTMPPVRYEALYEGFLKAREWVKSKYRPSYANTEWTFHLPMLGSNLAGGDFNTVFKMYCEAFKNTNSRSMFYALHDEDFNLLKKIYENNKI